ncbi:MAG TPA: DUF4760 domain-containing protein [Mycobacteriales bacterium]|nr:DUF4760 domain-containing protein [Mycobacteriales bacterium]
MAASKDDAMLMVQLLALGAQTGLNDAMSHVMRPGFDPDQVDASDKPVQTILNFGETVATFVKQGLLDKDLVHDLLWLEGMWTKVGPAALKVREAAGEKRLYENFEALAKG